MKKIFIFAAILAAIYLVVFSTPQSVEKFSLNPELTHEVWRFFTYPFAHIDIKHLAENLIGLGIVAIIAVQLKSEFFDFSSTYLSSGFISAIPMWIALSFTALGASNAIMGGFGMISLETKKYNIKSIVVVLVMSLLIFMKSSIFFFTQGPASPDFIHAIKQDTTHFFGFLFGMGFFYLLIRYRPFFEKRKVHILRGDIR